MAHRRVQLRLALMDESTLESELADRLEAVTLADRARLQKRLNGARRLRGQRKARALHAIESALADAEQLVSARRAQIPQSIAYPEDLPIVDARRRLLDAIVEHQVVVVAGETGSGKSTQLPKLCLELGRGVVGRIGHTQPRRIAARSIAERIADELGKPVGGLVGYQFRFTDEVGEHSVIKVMTDGILLNELQRDRRLLDYDTIIIDEAHERSLNIDFLLGYFKRLLPQRPELKVIVTSATIDTERFASHFDGAPIVEVSGRTYPVEVRYRPLVAEDGTEPRDQTEGILDAVQELAAAGSGDILVFCSGEREIRDATDALESLELRRTEVLPLFGRLSAAEQHRVFSGHRGRRIVVATNVAETSLTVPGIRYVVDAGTARISRFSRRTKVQRLPIEPISRASADQRAGRCGRLGPGVCIRLYSEDDYLGRPEFTDPEILRTSLAAVILQMAAIGLGDIEAFPFVEAPDTRTVRDGIGLLEELQAVGDGAPGSRDWLTEVGRRLARIPLDPRLGRMLLAAHDEGSLRDVMVIAAALSIIDPRERPTGREPEAEESHRRFADETSDFASILSLWRHIMKSRRELSSGQFRRMCRSEFLNWRRVREWQDVHSQLRRVAKDLGMRVEKQPAAADAIHRALLAGLLSHVGHKDPDSYEFRGVRGARFAINPGSVLFKKSPEWVMAGELVETSRTWARVVAPVSPEVIEDMGAHLLRHHVSDPWWDATAGAAVAAETVTMLGLEIVSGRRVLAGRLDPAAARELFIRHALVANEWDAQHDFIGHNRRRIAEVEALEARGRVDLMVDDEALVRFYDRRIPDDVVSVRHFDRWWRTHREDHPELLNLSEDDLIAADAIDVDDTRFPPHWSYGDVEFDLAYEFDPTSASDGVTVTIPAALLDRVDPTSFEWNVPGFRRELIAALLRSLPKRIRKQLVPIPDTAAEIVGRVGPELGGLLEVMRGEVTARTGELVMPDDFDLTALPPHVRPRFRVVDESAALLAAGDDLASLRDDLRAEARRVAAQTSHPIERTGITMWDFGDLPQTLTIRGDDRDVVAYPALLDEGDSVAIRLLATRREQIEGSWQGVRRLLILHLPSPARLLRAVLSDELKLAVISSPYSGVGDWMEDCLLAAVDQLIHDSGLLVSTAEQFAALLAVVRDGLADEIEAIGATSASVLEELRNLELVAADLPDRFSAAWEDVAQQVGTFIYPGFVSGVGAGRLADLARYVAGASHRLAKLPEHPGRDNEMMTRIRPLEAELDQIVESLPWRPEMLEVTWMLQELRVSLFAQHLGTSGTVSEKRLRRALDELAQPT